MLLKALAGVVLMWAGSANAAFILETAGAQSATHDTVTDNYWYPSLSFFGGSDFAFVESQIASLNAASYFGISNWHLATPSEVDTLLFSSDSELFGAFSPTHTSQSFQLIADPNDFLAQCFPSLGIFTGCVQLDIVEEHRFGIFDDPFTLELLLEIAGLIPGATCGTVTILGNTIDLGPCGIPIQVDAHRAGDFVTTTLSVEGTVISGFTDAVLTSSPDQDPSQLGLEPADFEPIWGAWVVGTLTGGTSGPPGPGGGAGSGTVPEPASLALLGIGLAGLGFARKKKAH